MLRLLARPKHRSYRALISVVLIPRPHPQRHPRTMSSDAASSSQPDALQNGPHVALGPGEGKKQPKEKKDKAQSTVSQYPLEVSAPYRPMHTD